ncbi:kinase-like domain-containing protein [Mycena sp. CBHHK59/15]|nr:kinase-like domain-containing protein [Mycena sp. CBHHK59/15]
MFTGSESDSQKSRLQFCREALLWQTLRHPFILPMIGIDSEIFPSSFCMVSPWMEHGTVLTYIRERRADLTKLLLEIAYGLQYLHSMNVVHGDLRGANILITDNGSACLTDFGLASVISGTLTSGSNHAGSMRWFAPELMLPQRFGFEKFARSYATDIYAYGCVCLELHTRKPPFSDVKEDATAMLNILGGNRPERPMADDSLISNDWWELLTKAWSQDARARPSISDIIESIEKFAKK